jgi:MerR family copper efflux transcriptional regulator
MRIGDLSARSGLGIDTIRFYEKRGLLDSRHVRREPNGYRRYSGQALDRLLQIREAQSGGFTLREIERMLKVLDSGRLTPARVRAYCMRKLEEVEGRISELQQLRSRLSAAISSMECESMAGGATLDRHGRRSIDRSSTSASLQRTRPSTLPGGGYRTDHQ